MKSRIEENPLSPGRLRHESLRAYRAFSVFRDLGPERSQDLAWKRFCADQGKTTKSTRRPTHWAIWSKKFRWVERAEAYDDLMDEERREKAVARRAERLKRASEFQERADLRAQNLVRSADRCLSDIFNNPVKTGVVQSKVDKAAGTKIIRTIKPTNFREAAALFDTRNKTVKDLAERMHSLEGKEEEKRIERVVWIKAPTKNPSEPDLEPNHGRLQPVSDLDAELQKLPNDEKETECDDPNYLGEPEEDKAA